MREQAIAFFVFAKYYFLIKLEYKNMNKQTNVTRRRGKVLENAILKAARDELAETGYTNLKMENVAKRAKTNKAVLYRRWANKSELVISVLHKYLPKITNDIPNTGKLRNDVYTYLYNKVEPLKSIGAQTIRGLMMEPEVWSKITEAIPQTVRRMSNNEMTLAMTEILKNAELRGEISMENINLRIITLPLNLLQYELISKLEPISDETIAEIVDDVFLPLVYAKQ